MNILPYKLSNTNDQLTSRAGLLSIAELMKTLKLSDRIDQHFTLPKSNRGFKPSSFIQTLILMQHEGSFHLDDVRFLHEDKALLKVLNLKQLPKASSIGNWLRRMGKDPQSIPAWKEINKRLLKSALHNRKGITLDIDATEIIANKADAQWTYKKNKGYMPMVGHVSETGQIVDVDFRTGNTSPNSQNLEFIQQCEATLPDGCFVKQLRIDSAGYQRAIIEYCDKKQIAYAIRAKSSANMKKEIALLKASDWAPLLNKKGQPIKGEATSRIPYWITGYDKPFTLVIQRKAIECKNEDINEAQLPLDLVVDSDGETVNHAEYIYRAIATNRSELDNNEIVHWYNQRAEDSENRIKELKLDFGGDVLPCSDFKANALYFLISSLSFNLFALMRHLLPLTLANHRVMTIRWRVYAMAAKVVKTGRRLYVKCQNSHQCLLSKILLSLKEVDPLPI